MNAIPTFYAGVQFRSRLEAKWAAFFETQGWDWDYEPIDCAGWIPDFVLKFKVPVAVEVKPAMSLDALEEYTTKIDSSDWTGEVLLVGATVHFDDTLGLLRETWQDESGDVKAWGHGVVFVCVGGCACCCGFGALGEKLHMGLCSANGSYQCRRCGIYGGDHHFGPKAGVYMAENWKLAGNDVQWKAPRR